MAFIEIHTIDSGDPQQVEQTLFLNLQDVVAIGIEWNGRGSRIDMRDRDELLVSDTLEEIKATLRRLNEL